MNDRDRIAKIMECEGLNAKQFSQEIGVSAGTISNIMGGRNQPSLEVVKAIIRRFRTINCLWLLEGVGNMYLTTPADAAPRLPFPDEDAGKNAVPASTTSSTTQPATTLPVPNQSVTSPVMPSTPPRTVRKVVIFYSDGTFEER